MYLLILMVCLQTSDKLVLERHRVITWMEGTPCFFCAELDQMRIEQFTVGVGAVTALKRAATVWTVGSESRLARTVSTWRRSVDYIPT